MKSKFTVNYAHFACYLSLMMAWLPVVDYYCNWVITVVPFLVLIYVLNQHHDGSTNKAMYVLLCGLSITLLQGWIQYRNVFLSRLINGIVSWLPLIVAIYLQTCNDRKFIKRYINFALILITATNITSIIGLTVYPMAARELASGTTIYNTSIYLKRNMGGYEYIYSLVAFIPTLLCIMEKEVSNRQRWKYIIAFVILLLCVFKSQYTIALVCAVLALFLPRLVQKRRTTGFVICAAILFLMLGGLLLLSDLFLWVSNILVDASPYVSDRLLQVSQLLSGAKIATKTNTERLDLYQRCIESFMESPLWGHNLIEFKKWKISGHSTALDMIAGGGIISFVLEVRLFYLIIKKLLTIRGKIENYYISTIIIFFVVSALNITSHYMVFNYVVFTFPVCLTQLECEPVNYMRRCYDSNVPK